MKRQIQIALHESLNGTNGLYARIKSGMDEFHAMRAEEIRTAASIEMPSCRRRPGNVDFAAILP